MEHSPKSPDAGYAHKEETDGDLCPHERGEGLDPFAVGIFPEFSQLMWREELLMLAEAIMGFDEIEAGAYRIAELDGPNVSIMLLENVQPWKCGAEIEILPRPE